MKHLVQTCTNDNHPTRPSEVPLTQQQRPINVISYEGSPYKTDFWEGQGREFEDLTERQALGRLLPPRGKTLIEIGSGFGRLANLYSNYEQIILTDYSLSLLTDAKKSFGSNPRYRFVAANVYNLPFANNLADTMVMIRVAHHLESIPSALAEIQRVMQGDGTFIMEFANKRNIKAIARYWTRRQTWSPFAEEPYEFVRLNFDFHPRWMQQALSAAGFNTEKMLALSNFRIPAIKRRISARTLARIDNALAGPGAALSLSPSILTKNKSTKAKHPASGLFLCPKCKQGDLESMPAAMVCNHCHEHWTITNGIIDFRYPRPDAA
jgi:ubiquinone/menaquinone biosynthesis C-methylase UbiE